MSMSTDYTNTSTAYVQYSWVIRFEKLHANGRFRRFLIDDIHEIILLISPVCNASYHTHTSSGMCSRRIPAMKAMPWQYPVSTSSTSKKVLINSIALQWVFFKYRSEIRENFLKSSKMQLFTPLHRSPTKLSEEIARPSVSRWWGGWNFSLTQIPPAARGVQKALTYDQSI